MIPILTAATFAVLSLGFLGTPIMAQESQSQSDPAQGLSLNTPTYEGCFSISDPLVDQGSYTYQAMGWCQPWCVRQNKPVLGFSNGTNCWCGDAVPSASMKVSDDQCNVKCNGYGQNTCGGTNAFAVWNDGLNPSVSNSDSAPTSNPSSTPSAAASITDSGSPTQVTVASTVFVTAPGSTSAQIVYTTQAVSPSSSGPSKAAIAAGVVVGIVALCAIVGGILFWVRHRRRRAIEEEHRRMEKTQSPSSTSVTDSRLEPSVMFQRRMSDGSIADNQDYSRRILKVANPDMRASMGPV